MDDDSERLPVAGNSLPDDATIEPAFVAPRTWPTDARLERLARAIAHAPLIVDDQGYVRPADALDPDAEDGPQVAEELDAPIEVEVRIGRLEFDGGTGTIRPQPLAERTVVP